MVPISTRTRSTTRENGTQERGVAGEGCTTPTALSMKGSGLGTNATGVAC